MIWFLRFYQNQIIDKFNKKINFKLIKIYKDEFKSKCLKKCQTNDQINLIFQKEFVLIQMFILNNDEIKPKFGWIKPKFGWIKPKFGWIH